MFLILLFMSFGIFAEDKAYNPDIAETWCKVDTARNCESEVNQCISPLSKQEAPQALVCMNNFKDCISEGYVICEIDRGFAFWMEKQLNNCKQRTVNACFATEMDCIKSIEHEHQQTACQEGYKHCVNTGYHSCDLEFS